jgi:phage repressor protein C with HTH and peptisase S24 domain
MHFQAKNTGLVFACEIMPLYRFGMDDLKTLREAVGLTQAQLAELADTSQPQIKRLESGERELTRTWAERLAPHLGTTAVRLLFPDDAVDEGGQVRGRLISWVSAGALLKPDAPIQDDDAAQWVYAPDLDPQGDWIVLRVDGDSMNRISPHDSLIFVNRKDRRLVPNACYVIGDGEGGATYKRYRPPNTWEPVSTNPVHQPIRLPMNQEPDIIGRVRKTVLSM